MSGKKDKGSGVPKGHDEGDQVTEIVDQVVAQIVESIGYCKCQPADTLVAQMKPKYRPGFEAALQQNPSFWDLYKGKVLLMAGLAGAVASLCAVRERGVSFMKVTPSRPVVEVEHLLMAMGIVRSICTIGQHGFVPSGLPCNRVNFPISGEIKQKIATVFSAITMDLLTDDPTPALRSHP
jgi:hypothetical protein